jgi:glutathione S-transferase
MATYRYQRTFTPNPDPNVLAYFRRRIDDFLSILNQHLARGDYVVGRRPTIVDFSMMAYRSYPNDETGYDLADSHPSVHAWLGRLARLPGWCSPYELLPGQRLVHFA